MNSQYQESYLTPKSFSLPLHCTPIAVQAASSATNESYSLALDSEMQSLTNVLKISKENTIQCETAQNSAARDCSKNIQLIDFEEFQRSEEASGCHHHLLGINEPEVSLNQQESTNNKEFLKDFEKDFQISKVRLSSITPTSGQLRNPQKDNVIVEENDSECSRSSDRILLLNNKNIKQEKNQISRQDSKEFKKIQSQNSNQRLTTNSSQQNESASNRQNSWRVKENLQIESNSHRNSQKECEDQVASPSASLKMVRHEFKNMINNYKQRTSVSLSHENGILNQHQHQQQQQQQQEQQSSQIQIPKQVVSMMQNKTGESKINGSSNKGDFFLVQKLHTSDAELSRYLSCEESQALVLEATGEQFLFHSSEIDKGEKLERLQISNEFLPTGSSGFSSNLLAETIYSGQESNRMYVINSEDKSRRQTTVTGRNERLDFNESAEKNNLKKEIIKLLGELQEAEKEIKRCNEVVRQQKRDINVLEQNIQFFKSELDVKDDEISAKQQIVDNKDQQISTLFKEREGLKMKKKALKDTVEQLRHEVEEVRRNQSDEVIYQADREILELQQDLADKDRYIAGQMEYFKKQQGTYNDQINGLQHEIEALQRHNVHLQRLNQSLASEIKFGEKITNSNVNTINNQDNYQQLVNKQALIQQQQAFQFKGDNDSAIYEMDRNNCNYKNQSGIECTSGGNISNNIIKNMPNNNVNTSMQQNTLGRSNNNPSRIRSFSHNDSSQQQQGPSINIIDSYQPSSSVSNSYLPISKSSSNSSVVQYEKNTIITEPSLNKSSIDIKTLDIPKNSPMTQQNNLPSHQRTSSCSSNQLRHSYDSYRNIQRFQEPQQLQVQQLQSQQHEKQQKQLQQFTNQQYPQNTQQNEQFKSQQYSQQTSKQQQQLGSEREPTPQSNLSPFPSKGSHPGWDSANAPKSSASTSCNSKHLDNSHYQAHESITSRFSSNSSSQRQQQLQQHDLINPLHPSDPSNTFIPGMHLNPACNIPKPTIKRNRAESSYESTSNNSRNSSGAASHNLSYNEDNSRLINQYVSQGNQKDNYKSREIDGRYVRAWSIDVPQSIGQKFSAVDILKSNDFLPKDIQSQPKYQQQQYFQIEQVALQNKIALNNSEFTNVADPLIRKPLSQNKNTNNTSSSSQYLSQKPINTQPDMQKYNRKSNDYNSIQQSQVAPNIKPFHTESSDNISYPLNTQGMYQLQPIGSNKGQERRPPRNQLQENNLSSSVVSGNYQSEDLQQRQLLPYKQIETNYNRKRNGDASTASYGSFKAETFEGKTQKNQSYH